MKNLRFLIVLICLSLVLISCTGLDKQSIKNNVKGESQDIEEKHESSDPEIIKGGEDTEKQEDNIDDADKVDKDLIVEKIKTMTLDEKIGQLVITGFEGQIIDDNIKSLINEYKVGGFILFARNIKFAEGSKTLLNQLKEENKKNKIPLFLAIDEEGGRVSRLTSEYHTLPTALNVAEKKDFTLSYKLGEILAMRLASLGLNLNFAPVLDIYSNPINTVIGNRAFGKSVEEVKNNGLLVMEAMRDRGIISAVKHFPGHGDTSIDSHLNLPKVDKSLEELMSFELKPFQAAIEKNVPMIMVAHILYPKIDSMFPSSMSKDIITGILREDMSYEGLVISDDMTMGAIVNDYSVEDASLEFLKAGGDIALICHDEINTINTIAKIKQSVEDKTLSVEDIDKKVYRIIRLKEEYKLSDTIVEKLDLEILNKETEEFLNNFK